MDRATRDNRSIEIQPLSNNLRRSENQIYNYSPSTNFQYRTQIASNSSSNPTNINQPIEQNN